MGWGCGGKGDFGCAGKGPGYGGNWGYGSPFDMAYEAGLYMGKGAFPKAGPGFGKGDFNAGYGWPAELRPKTAKGMISDLTTSSTLPGGRRWENNENTLFVGSLPEDMTDVDMYHMFAPFGPIMARGASARIDAETGKCTGIGFINYLDAESATKAIRALSGHMLSDGSRLTVKLKGPPKNKGEKGDGKGGKVNVGGKGGKRPEPAPKGGQKGPPMPSIPAQAQAAPAVPAPPPNSAASWLGGT